jgi:PAS domain S-box-containing protein
MGKRTLILIMIVFSALSVFSCLEPPYAGAAVRTVTVGVYENAPKVFTSESGKPSGIFIDIIEHIAKIEEWDLRYVSGTWGEGLDRVERGEIDLMPDVAYSAARARIYSFHKTPVLSSWYQVYAPKGSNIRSIVDLNNKRILVLERSVQQAAFIRLSKGFGFKSSIIPVPDYKTMFEMVARGEADAAITNRFYGMMHAGKFGLEDTAVVFEPSDLFFAAPKNEDREILDAIDSHLMALKQNHESMYYASLKKWTAEEVRFKLPDWLKIVGLIAGIVLLMSLAGSYVLKHQVNARTQELRTSAQRYRHLFERNPAPMLIYQRGTFQILAVNDAFTGHYGYSTEEALSLHLQDLYPEEEKGHITEVASGLAGHAYAGEWHHLKANGEIISIVAKSHDIDYWGHDARVAVITDITDRKRAEVRLRRANRTLFAISRCIDLVAHAVEEQGLMDDICKSIIGAEGYLMAWIGFAVRDEKKTVRPVAWAGFEDGYLESLYITWSETEHGGGPTGSAVRTGKPSICQYFLTDPRLEPWRAEAVKRGYAASIALPLSLNERAFGVLTIYSDEPDAFDEEEVAMLSDMAETLAFGIGSLRTKAEQIKAERELEKHRLHLEEMVNERTVELNAKIAEIERINKLFVDREVRMIELKDKIKELESGNR